MAKQPRKKTSTAIRHEDLVPLIHSAFDTYQVDVFNGGEATVRKPIGVALTAISQDVREVRNSLKTNTEKTEENSVLLTGMRERRAVVNVFTTFVQNFASAFKVKFIYKIAIGMMGIYTIWHGAHDIPQILSNISEWISKL